MNGVHLQTMLGKEVSSTTPVGKSKAAGQKLKIAIDGPAGAGKSTVARMVAERLNYRYLDTGAMYRAAALLVVESGISFDDQEAIAELVKHASIDVIPGEAESGEKVRIFLNGREVTEDIRRPDVTNASSPVSLVVSVRQSLVKKQRELASSGGVVLDGRDIGTVVLPEADLKIFLTASSEIRAKRRYDELIAAGKDVNLSTILADVVARDHRDSNRSIAPLSQAQDAVMILSDHMSLEQVVDAIIKLAEV
jgi:cytidylate kinase